MPIEINNKKFLSYEEQVLKNKEDIERLQRPQKLKYIDMYGTLYLPTGTDVLLTRLVAFGSIYVLNYELELEALADTEFNIEGDELDGFVVDEGKKCVIAYDNAHAYVTVEGAGTITCSNADFITRVDGTDFKVLRLTIKEEE